MRSFAFLLCAACATTPAAKPVSIPMPRAYVAPHAVSAVVVDGKLDDAVWDQAPWTADFVDIEGDRKPRPRFRTRVKMAWDATYLYVAADMEEPHLQATFTKRDSYIFHADNDFEVFLDPDGDTHRYFEFEMNALNTMWDLMLVKPYRDGGPAIDGWDCAGLKHAVHLDGTLNDPRDTDRGWSVELAIPWTSLPHKRPRRGDHWRINFSRVQWHYRVEGGAYVQEKKRGEDNWVWSPQGVVAMHRPETWGYLQFGGGAFRAPADHTARWLLREIYYGQRKRLKKGQPLATHVNQLALPDVGLAPRLVVAGKRFRAVIDRPGGKPLAIDEQGRLR